MRTRTAVLSLLIGCALAAAGCGNDDQSQEATTPATVSDAAPAPPAEEPAADDRLTKDEYIAAADAICAEASATIDALPEPQTFEELAAQGEEVIELSQAQLANLRALRPPAADEARLNEAYDLIDEQIELIRQLVAAARAGDEAGIQAIVAEGEEIEAQADAIAQEYGLQECGSD